ncbi:hypothetical protein [Streptomyces sp. NPDC046182]|uniref:hypothetical protein n=1 Tax=Streptomyces sp. NPDC046182 TaxID=3154601 RepID=UPI0033FCC558
MKHLRTIAAGVLFLQVAYVSIAEIFFAIFLVDTSEIDHTDPPATGGAFYVAAEVAVLGVLLFAALVLAVPKTFERLARPVKRTLFAIVALLETAIIVGVLMNIVSQAFGPDEMLNVVMIILCGAAAYVSAAEVPRRGSETVRAETWSRRSSFPPRAMMPTVRGEKTS